MLYSFIEFGKNANSIYVSTVPYCVRYVSRQSKFVFFVRWLRLAHFLFYGGFIMKREDYEILNMSNEENAELEMAKMECESNINEQKQRNKKVIFGVIIGIVVIGLALVLLLSLLNNQKTGKYVGTKSGETVLGESSTWETVINLKSNGDYTLTVTRLQSNIVTLTSTGTYRMVGENNSAIIFTEVGGSTFQGEFLVNIHGQSFISLIDSGLPSSSGYATACYKS